MARLNTIGFELNDLTAGVEMTAKSASNITIDASIKRSGAYSLKANPPAGAAWTYYTFANGTGKQVMYYRFYVYITSMPSGNGHQICGIDTDESVVYVNINTNGTLRINDAWNGVDIGSASSALETNRWYRVEVYVNTTTLSSSVVQARLEGVEFCNATINLTGVGQQQRFLLGTTFSHTYTAYFDDVAINDNTGTDQNSWCGDEKVLYLHIGGPDTTNQSMSIGGSSPAATQWESVDEVTPDDGVTTLVNTTVNDVSDFRFAIPTTDIIKDNDTINLIHGCMRFADTSVAASGRVRFKPHGGSFTNGSTVGGAGDSVYYSNNNTAPRNPALTMYYKSGVVRFRADEILSGTLSYQVLAGSTNNIVTKIWLIVCYTPNSSGRIGNYERRLKVGDNMSRSETSP